MKMTTKTIGIASDHAGYELKEEVKKHLNIHNVEIIDFGTRSDESVDYADYAHPLAISVEEGKCELGIAICGSGNGINMTINKHHEIRGALCWTPDLARLARLHNDANVCSLPARFVSIDNAKDIIDTFLETSFEGGRHLRRIRKITQF